MNRQKPQSGYVLIFVLGVVFVLSVMVLGMSSGTRVDASAVTAHKRTTQSGYLLQGALQRVIWGLESGQIRWDMVPPPPQKEAFEWSGLLGQTFQVAFDGRSYRVRLEDAAAMADPNLLTRDMWSRLGLVLGLSPAESLRLADQVDRSRAAQQAVGPEPLFRNLDDIADIQGLSKSMVYGAPNADRPALVDLLAFGNASLTLDINRSPLALYRIVHNIDDGKARTLAQWRAQRLLTEADERQLLGGNSASRPSVGTAPAARQMQLLKVTLAFDGRDADPLQLLAFVRSPSPVASVRSTVLFYSP